MRRVSRKRFLQIKAELSKILRDLGYTYRIYRKPINWEIGPGVNGWFDEYKRKITVHVRGKEGYPHILFVLAHEVRHAIHVSENLYKSYYGLNNKLIEMFIKGSKVQWKWPNLGVAIRAERDCDDWAVEFLRQRGIEYERKCLYNYRSTASYTVHCRLKGHLRKLKHDETRDQRFLEQGFLNDSTASVAGMRADSVHSQGVDDRLLPDQR